MAFASWLRLPKFSFASAPKMVTSRQPLRSRLFLESLESRMLLSGAGAEFQLGGVNNATFNFNLASAGITLPSFHQMDNPQAIAQNEVVNDGLGIAITDAEAGSLAQDQRVGQFRAFGVNSEGEGNILQVNQQLIIRDAYGFGSGVQPNAPWAPAAYNLGLANHQYGYPSQADMGFSSVPPWFHRVEQSIPRNQPLDEVEAAKETLEQPLTQPSENDSEQERQRWMDEDTDKKNEEEKAPIEEPAFEEQAITEKTVPSLTRGDPATEDALFNDSVQTLTVAALAAGLPVVEAPAESGEAAVGVGASE